MVLYCNTRISGVLRQGLYCTDKKENQILLIYKEIQSGAVVKSYMRKCFLKYEKMRKYVPIYEEAVSDTVLATAPF